MKNKTSLMAIVLLISFSSVDAQFTSISTVLGMGNIQSNSPSETTMDIKLQLRERLEQLSNIQFGISYFYTRKIEYYLPENRAGRYYPYFQGLAVFVERYGDDLLELNYKGGIAIINDRMFSDRNDWAVGLDAGLSMTIYRSTAGFYIGAEGDYMIAFSGYSPSYFSLGVVLGQNL